MTSKATMASEASKMAIRGNVRMNIRLLEVACFKSEVKFDLFNHRGHLEAEATMASKVTLKDVLGHRYIDTKTIEIIQHHFLKHLCPCCCRSIGSLAIRLMALCCHGIRDQQLADRA